MRIKRRLLSLGLSLATAAAVVVTVAVAGPPAHAAGELYRITNRGSGKVMDVVSGSTVNNAEIKQYGWNSGTNQRWEFQDAGSGYFRIVNQKSGMCVDVAGASTADGANIIQYTCGSGTNQQWQWAAIGSYFQIRGRQSGKCLDVVSSSTADGGDIQLYTCGSGNNQQWSRTQEGAVTPPSSTTPPPSGWRLVWADEFDGPTINTSNWDYEIGYKRNNEQQYYTNRSQNARIENGQLLVEARRESYNGYAYTSASLHTSGKRQFTYGRFELRAQIPTAAGSWPAWWTLGINNPWPRNGEIDIMEFYRGMILANVAYQNSGGNIVWDSFTKQISTYPSGWANQYHTWVMEWETNEIRLYVDGTLLNSFNVNSATVGSYNPFRQPHYMLVNLAIGGNNGGNPSGTAFPLQYRVDYVRVYQR
jgi:beta-glucanase (GH16 family)